MLNGIFSFSSKQQQIKGMTMYQVVYDMCIAIPRPFTDRVFTGIAEYIDNHTLNECKVHVLQFIGKVYALTSLYL
ncbi:unnamed protein product [Mucor hiemalis]